MPISDRVRGILRLHECHEWHKKLTKIVYMNKRSKPKILDKIFFRWILIDDINLLLSAE